MFGPLARILSPLGLAARVATYQAKVLATAPLAYWPLAEASGSTAADASGNGRTGSYTNVTLGQTGIGDGQTAARWNGSTSLANMLSGSLASAFSGNAGTIALWFKMASGAVWSDGGTRQMCIVFVDGSNFMVLQKGSSINQMFLSRIGGGVSKDHSLSLSPTAWTHLALTWSTAAGEQRAYIDGAQVGATLTGLGTWAGTPNRFLVGATNTTPVQVHNGDLAHVAVWNSALAPATIASLATV